MIFCHVLTGGCCTDGKLLNSFLGRVLLLAYNSEIWTDRPNCPGSKSTTNLPHYTWICLLLWFVDCLQCWQQLIGLWKYWPATHRTEEVSTRYSLYQGRFNQLLIVPRRFQPGTHCTKEVSTRYSLYQGGFNQILIVPRRFQPDTHCTKDVSTSYSLYRGGFNQVLIVPRRFQPGLVLLVCKYRGVTGPVLPVCKYRWGHRASSTSV